MQYKTTVGRRTGNVALEYAHYCIIAMCCMNDTRYFKLPHTMFSTHHTIDHKLWHSTDNPQCPHTHTKACCHGNWSTHSIFIANMDVLHSYLKRSTMHTQNGHEHTWHDINLHIMNTLNLNPQLSASKAQWTTRCPQECSWTYMTWH